MPKVIQLCGLILGSAALLLAVQLTSETAGAFDRYIEQYESHRFTDPAFLRALASEDHGARLRNGELVVFPGKSNGDVPVKSGIVHDWVGTMFVPGTTLEKTLSVIQDYPRQPRIYAPEITDARVLAHPGQDEFRVYVRVVKNKYMVSDVLNTEHLIRFTKVSPDRVYCRSYSTKVAEVANAGTKQEHELSPGEDRGYMWRMYGYWFFEQKDNGVYVEYESISLSRDVPMLMGKILGPLLHSVPAESLRTSMEKTRKAILATAAAPASTK